MTPWLFVALTLLGNPSVEQAILLEIRAFDGVTEVSEASRVIVHRAGQREQPVAQLGAGAGRTVKVAPGIYDVQAIHEVAGRVVNIRWAERLVVMPYPDEAGHHLEVINFQTGYGALQVRDTDARASDADVALFAPKDHTQPAGARIAAPAYALFVVRAGAYDIFVKRGAKGNWHPGVDVPLDRTRLWIVP